MHLRQIQEEFKAEIIGEIIYREIAEAARQLLRKYDPSIYARRHSWEAHEDFVQEFITYALCEDGQLEYLVTEPSEINGFRKLLFYMMRRFLAKNRQRTVIDNLLDRCKQLLDSPPFQKEVSSASQTCFYVKKGTERREPTELELKEAKLRIGGIPKNIPKDSDRAPIEYTQENLFLALKIVARTLPCWFTIKDLDRIFRSTLTYWLPGSLKSVEDLGAGVERALNVRGGENTPEEDVLVRDATMKILSKLSDEQKAILQLKIAGSSDAIIAARLAKSRPTIAKNKIDIYALIEPEISDFRESMQARVIDEITLKLCLGEEI